MSQPIQKEALADLYQQYPGLKRYGIQTKDSRSAGVDWRGQPYAGRKMEFYPADESYNPNPGKPTIEVFSDDVSSKDAMGEVFSHLLPNIDPDFKAARSKFIASIDPKQKEMLSGDYQSQLKSGVYPKGQQPSFDQWLNTGGGDAFFRGYVADQYPKEFYRPDQVAMFTPLLEKLGVSDKAPANGISVNIEGVGKVTFPQGMTPEQIKQAIERDILPHRSSPASAKPEAPTPQEKPTLWERWGGGAQDQVDRYAQMVVAAGEKLGLKGFPEGLGDEMTRGMNEEKALYEKGRGENAGIDLARIAGNIGMQAPLALIPGGKESALARAGAGAIQGAASGLLQYDPTNSLEGTAKNIGIGTVAGAVISPVAGLAADKFGQAVRWLSGRIKGAGAPSIAAEIVKAVPDIQSLPPAQQATLISEAQAQIKATGKLNADELARKANLIAQGLTPTKASVTRNPRDWTMERNLQKLSQSPDEEISKVGQELTTVYQGNDKALVARIEQLAKGLPAGTQEAHGMAVMNSIDDLAKASQKEVSKFYDSVRAARGDEVASDSAKFMAALDELSDSPAADVVTNAAKRRLIRLGVMDNNGRALGRPLTVKEAEGLRQFINQQPSSYGKPQLIRAIDEDVVSVLGDDAFSAARSEASQRFAMLDNPATQRALNTLGELNQGKTAQNFIKSQVIDAADQDVAALVGTLSKLPPEKAAQSINSLRAGVLQHLQDKAINVNSGKFSGDELNKAIKRIGETKLIRVLGPTQYQDLQNFARAALDATFEPPYSAVNHSGSGSLLLSMMRKARGVIGIPLPGLNEVAETGLQRMSAKSQLADALGAGVSREMPKLSDGARDLIRIFSQTGTPAGVAALNQSTKKPNSNRQERQ